MHIGADVDRQHQLGAAEHDRLDLLLGELGDQRLQLALAVADDAAGGQLLVDDPVDLAAPSRRRSARARCRAPRCRSRTNGSVMVKRVPSSATRLRPSATSRSAVGVGDVRASAGATRPRPRHRPCATCWTPAAGLPRRRLQPLARPRSATAATPSQSSDCCIAAIGARSRLSIARRALCSPPRRWATPRLICS